MRKGMSGYTGVGVLLVCLLLAYAEVGWSQANLLPNGTFDASDRPHFWRGERTGGTQAELVWATDRSRSMDRSVKIVKQDKLGEAMWVSSNMNQYWTRSFGAGANGDITRGGFAPGILLEVGGWVQTDGVNVNPATDEETIYLAFSFYDSSGSKIFGQDVVVPLPQTEGSVSDWVEVKSDPFQLPVRADSLVIMFKFGRDATGTAWVDDVFLRKVDPGAPGWEGDIFNNSFNAPEGWFYWWMNFPRGEIPVTATISDDAALSGRYSLKIVEEDTDNDEVVFISDFVPVDASKLYVLSAWVKTEGFSADSAKVNNGYRIGFTVTWHRGIPGWQEIRGEDKQFEVASSNTDWTQYAMLLRPPEDAKYVSVRARYWNFATGTTYWDNFSVTPVPPTPTGITDEDGTPDLTGRVPQHFGLMQNFPNPFNPETVIEFEVPQNERVTIAIYNSIGQHIRTLLDRRVTAGVHRVRWDALDKYGNRVPTGVYIYQMRTKSRVLSRKMLLMK